MGKVELIMQCYVNGFLKYLNIEKNTSSNTNVKYKADLTKLSNFLKNKFNITEPTEVETCHIRSYLEYIKEKSNLIPSSMGNKIAVIKSFFSYLHPTEAIPKIQHYRLKNQGQTKNFQSF